MKFLFLDTDLNELTEMHLEHGELEATSPVVLRSGDDRMFLLPEGTDIRAFFIEYFAEVWSKGEELAEEELAVVDSILSAAGLKKIPVPSDVDVSGDTEDNER